MSVVAKVIQALIAAGPVYGRISNRIYNSRPPQEAQLPNLTVVKTSEREPYGLDAATGFREARVVVMCRAVSAAGADYLGDDVIAALKDYRAGDVTMQRDVIDRLEAVDADGKQFFVRTIGFVVWH